MEAEEILQLWHASFGPETQPPESLGSNKRLITAQDVGTELRACETRVESLRTTLTRELKALEWLRRLVADLERRASDGGDSTPRDRLARPLEGEGSAPRSRAASQPHRTQDKPAGGDLGSPSTRKSSSVPASPRRASRPDIVFSTSVQVAVKSKNREEHLSSKPPCGTTTKRESGTDSPSSLDDKKDTDGAGRERRGSVIRERAAGQANECVARAVRKRLIEQGKWWSSNLLTLGGSLQSQTPPTNRRRSVSDPPIQLNRGQHSSRAVPSVKVHKVIESFEKLSQETAPKVNAGTVEYREKEISHVLPRHTSLETVNEREKPSACVDNKKVEATPPQPPGERDRLGSLPVRRTQSESQEEKYIFPGCKNHVVYSTHSLNRRHVRSQLAQLQEEGPASSTLKRQQLSIEAKLADRRRTGGWKVVEVGGQRKYMRKAPSLQQINTEPSDKAAQQKEEHDDTENSTQVTQQSQQTNNSSGVQATVPVSEVATERRFTLVTTQSSNMFKAAKEKLSRVTSSPPLRRRLSRGSRGREGPHRSSNGQVEQASSSSSVSPSPVPSSGSGVQEVMVEKRVERSESLLSEIMSHRFSNGMEGSQLLESGEHSLLGSQEGGGGSESAGVSKVILRRRSERDNDPLPEAKRRSSCLEDDDCSTPKEDFSLSFADDSSMAPGLTKSMVDAKRSPVRRMESDSTLRQDSLEATLTPGNIVTSGGSPTPVPGNVNYRKSYMTAVHESPCTTPGGSSSGGGGVLRDSNQVDYMPLINESEGEMTAGHRLTLVASEPNLLGLDQRHLLEDSMELDEATISAVTLNNDMFGSRSGSVTSLPETLNDSQSTSTASLTEPFFSPSHTPAPVVNLRPSSGNSGVGRRRNRRREGNAELDDQTGASLVEMLSSSERLRSPNTTASSSQYSMTSSLSPTAEEVGTTIGSSPPTLFPPPLHHGAHLKEVETQSPGTTRSSRIYPVRRSTVVVQGEKLVIRKLVVAGIVSAEKSYLDCLNVMKEFYRKPLLARTTTSQVILSERDINTIFYRTEDLADLHATLHEKLEPQLRDWTVNTCVGDFFVDLCKNLKLYKDYVEFYRQSLQCLERLKSESAAFKTFLEDVRATVTAHYKDVPRVNELLRRPIERLQSYSLILNDLCQHTPEDHKDYSVLRQSLHVMSAFIASTHDPQSFSKLSGGYNRELVKEGLMVELSEGIRKVRRIFLFHDVIVSSKQKPTRAGMKFEPKWYLPLSELSFHPPEESPEAHRPVPATSDMDLSIMRNRIAELKAQIGKENTRERSGSQPEREGSFRRGRGGRGGRGGIRGIYTMKSSRAVERTKKKLQEQQVSYWMAVPSLPLRLYCDNGKQQYMFLLHSEQERENWLSSIKKLQPKAVRAVSFNPLELQDLLNHQTISELKKIEEVTQPVLEDEYLSGMLRIRIMSATDIKTKTGGIYCAVELDEYGRFERKAKTQPVPNDAITLGATWDQDFELEVTGAHIVKVNICGKQLLKEESYAHGKIRLPIHELRSNKRHKTDITLYPQGSLQIIIEYSSSAARDRKPALMSSGVFGVPIEVVSKRERHDIPLIVETCVEEVERRGMSEVGIYRVAGVLRDVKELREAFDTDYLKAQVIAFEADIHAVAGLLKKYFRELPDPLFTDGLYPSFVDGMGLSDPEAREQALVTLLYSLPPVNFKTAVFLFKHLRRIAGNSELNRMNLNNLATVFGPNLLRPAPVGTEESFLNMAAVDVATPVNVLMFFLSCPEELLDEAQASTSPSSTASTGRGRRRDSRKKLTWIEEEDGGGGRQIRTSRRSSGRTSQT